MKPEILVFDADGVLVEPWGFARELEHRYGIARDKTQSFFGGEFQDCMAGEADVRDVLPEFLHEWQWPHSLDDFVAAWMRGDDQPRHDVLQIIRRLRNAGHYCCLASNQEPQRAAYMAQQMNFAHHFDALYFSCELGAVKPAPEFYQAIERDLDVQPSRIHFWDDSPSHVEAALARGWNAWLFEGVESITRVVDPG